MKIRIYNVGHGNMVTIHQPINGIEKTILFDCGAIYTLTESLFESIQSYLKQNIAPNTIIISHKHIDHYAFCRAVNCDYLEHIIVNSELKEELSWDSFLAKEKLKGRIIIDLSKEKSLVGQPLNSVAYNLDYHNITIYLGTDSNRFYKDNLNDKGIILYIETQNGKMVLPGDCSYYSWPKSLNLYNLKYLLVPHHGMGVDAAWPPQESVPRLATEVYVSAQTGQIKNAYHRKLLERIFNPSTTYNYTNVGTHQPFFYYEINL